MGTTVTAKGAKAPWNAKYLPVVSGGLEGWFLFGEDSRATALNRAVGKKDGVVVGTPTLFPTYVRFKGNVNYLNTDISDTEEYTQIAVARRVIAQAEAGVALSSPIIGNYQGPSGTPGSTASFGANLYFGQGVGGVTGAAAKFNSEGTVTSNGHTLTMTNPTGWVLVASRGGSTGVAQRVDLPTENKSGSATNLFARVVGTNKMRIGGMYVSGSFTAETDIAFVAQWSRRLNDAEYAAQIEQIRAMMSPRGFSV